MTLPSELQAVTYQNMEQLYPTRVIARGAHVYPLSEGKPLNFEYAWEGKALDIAAFMRRNHTAGLLILHQGRVVLERYAKGNNENTKWMSFSLAKSISSTLVGAAIQDGLIDGLDVLVTDYLPTLKKTAYEGVTLRHILQMRSGVGWDENYSNPTSDRRNMLAIQVANVRGGVLNYMRQLSQVAAPGSLFNYSTGETYLIGEILASAIQKPLSTYLSEKIWRVYGMQSDAYWQLDAIQGQEFAGSGLSATLRDFGRFGQFILDNGKISNTQVLPMNWMREATSVDSTSLTAPGKVKGYEPLGYGYQWWTFPTGKSALENLDGGLFAALGIFGQQIYIHPQVQWIAVFNSTWPKPMDTSCLQETLSFLGAVHRNLCSSNVDDGSSPNIRL